MSKPVPALLPLLAGAIAAIAVVLVVGWPGRPLTGPAEVTAALAMAAVAVLLVVRAAAAARRPAVRQAIATPATRIPSAAPMAAPAPPSELLAA